MKLPVGIGGLILGLGAALAGRAWVERLELAERSRPSPLVISEVMYDPPALSVEEQRAGFADPQAMEFIEVANVSDDEVNLTGLRLLGGVRFQFREGALKPGEVVVIAKDLAAFKVRHRNVANVFGPYFGEMKSAGEELSLLDRSGKVLAEAAFQSEKPWPAKAAGLGHSLTLISPANHSDPRQPESWAASRERGGSPGRLE